MESMIVERSMYLKSRKRIFRDAEVFHLMEDEVMNEVKCDACKGDIPERVTKLRILLAGPWVVCEQCMEKYFWMECDE